MAFQSSPVLDFSFKAAEDLRDYQFRFVKICEKSQVRKVLYGEIPDGVLQNYPHENEEATVRILGVSKVVASTVLTEGTFIKADSGLDCGKAISSELSPQLTMGRVIGASQSQDDLCSVLLTPYVGL